MPDMVKTYPPPSFFSSLLRRTGRVVRMEGRGKIGFEFTPVFGTQLALAVALLDNRAGETLEDVQKTMQRVFNSISSRRKTRVVSGLIENRLSLGVTLGVVLC